MGSLQTPLICVLIFIHGELGEWQVWSHTNLRLQQGHATASTCQSCSTRVMIAILYWFICVGMSIYDVSMGFR